MPRAKRTGDDAGLDSPDGQSGSRETAKLATEAVGAKPKRAGKTRKLQDTILELQRQLGELERQSEATRIHELEEENALLKLVAADNAKLKKRVEALMFGSPGSSMYTVKILSATGRSQSGPRRVGVVLENKKKRPLP